MSHEHRRYERQVEQWVREALAQGACTLDEVVAALPGVYPTVVRNVLYRITSPQDTTRRWKVVTRPALLPSSSEAQELRLPPPHPLDYDWRFSNDTITELFSRVDSLIKGDDTVILLGTPSLLAATIRTPRPYKVALLDANTTMVNWFRHHAPMATVQHIVLGQDPLPPWRGQVIVADPPWYEEHLCMFLRAAAALVIKGGTILMAVPPIGTRPGIGASWTRVLEAAAMMGLVFERLERGALMYETPPFERNALVADSIYSLNWPWRRGDLAVFTCQSKVYTTWPTLHLDYGDWEEVAVVGVRLRLRRQFGCDEVDPELRPIFPNNILPTVSKRDPRRRKVDVWTAGNRVFACQNTALLKALLQARNTGKPPSSTVAAILGRPASSHELARTILAERQIDVLVRIERQELTEFWMDEELGARRKVGY